MKPRAYYNEFDAKAAAWLRELMRAGEIMDGEIDTRSIIDVRPEDLRGFTRCHFFAGIGGWDYALRLARWPEERPIWTGSCPCQPFSVAGPKTGTDDARHLWPVWSRLIEVARPPVVAGEQVADAIGDGWLDSVCLDLEGRGYAAGATVLPAACVGAPHGRHRLFFVAYNDEGRRAVECAPRLHDHGQPGLDASGCGEDGRVDDALRGRQAEPSAAIRAGRIGAAVSGDAGELGDAEHARLEGLAGHEHDGHEPGRLDAGAVRPVAEAGATRRMGDADRPRAGDREVQRGGELGWLETDRVSGPTAGFWADADWLPCRDGKSRCVEPGTFPLAHGLPARVGRLRGYGNAIVPQVAAEVLIVLQEILDAA